MVLHVITCNTANKKDAILRAIKGHSIHPSITRIKNTVKKTKRISFRKYRKGIHREKNHTHVKKVGHSSEFLFGIY